MSGVVCLDSPFCPGHGREGKHPSLGPLGRESEHLSLGVRPEAGHPSLGVRPEAGHPSPGLLVYAHIL